MKKKVAIDASRCRSGGAIEHFQNVFCKHMHKSTEVEYFCWLSEESYLPDMHHNFKYLKIMKKKHIFWEIFWQTFRLQYLLNYYKVDLLITIDTSSLCFFRPQISINQDLMPYEVFNEGLKKLSNKERLRLLVVRCFSAFNMKVANKLIFQTKYGSRLITEKLKIKKQTYVIPHACDDIFFDITQKKQLFTSDKTISITYVSNHIFYKNHKELIIALKNLSGSNLKIDVNFIGGGFDNSNVRKSFNDQFKNISNLNIYFLGQLSRNSIADIFKKSSILIFASSCESFGITLLEKMASSIPLACSNKSSLPELIGYEYPYFFDPKNSESIYLAIINIINDYELSKKHGLMNREKSKKFKWKKISEEYHKIIYKNVGLSKKE